MFQFGEERKNKDGARWELAREGRKPYDSLVHGNQGGKDSYESNHLNSGEQKRKTNKMDFMNRGH